MALGVLALLTALWGGLIRLGWGCRSCAHICPARSLDGVWLSWHADRRRACRSPGHPLAVCRPMAYRCGSPGTAQRSARTAIHDIGESGTGGRLCGDHAPPVRPGNSHYGAWRAAVAGWQRLLACRLATLPGCPVVEWLPGADHCRRTPGVEPYAPPDGTAATGVPAGSKSLPGRAPAPNRALCKRRAFGWCGYGGTGLVVTALRHCPAYHAADGIDALYRRESALWLWLAWRGGRAQLALWRRTGWAILRRHATRGLCRLCLCHDLWPCTNYHPGHPESDFAVSSHLLRAAGATARVLAAARGGRSGGMVARSPVGRAAQCPGSAPLSDHPGIRITTKKAGYHFCLPQNNTRAKAP